MFLVRVLLLWDCLLWPVLPYITRFWPHIYAISTEVFRKNTSVWYSTGSSPGDLPNERKISDLFICDQFSYQNPFIQLKNPPYKIARKQLKVSIDHFHRFFFFFLKIVRLPLAALTIRRPKHPVWQCCTTTFHREIFEDWSLEILIWNTIDIYTASNDHTKFSTAVCIHVSGY